MLRHRGARTPPTNDATATADEEFLQHARHKDRSTQNRPNFYCNCYLLWNACACVMCLSVLLVLFVMLVASANDGDSYFGETVTSSKISEWSTNQTIVITGANSVVAGGVVEHLLRANTARRLILVCRNRERCKDTVDQGRMEEEGEDAKIGISIVTMDLTSLESVRKCAAEIQEQLAADEDITLVWNAHDPLHDPIKTNALGHLYLTHLLYPHLKRIVVAASIVGGPKWPVAGGGGAEWKYSLPLAHYGTSKRALLFLAHHLWKHSKPALQVVVTQAGLTCAPPEGCAALSMTPTLGAKSHLRAMLDPSLGRGGEYVGHEWILWGRTIVAGTLDNGPYHWNLDPQQEDSLWTWSLQQLNISAFGTS